MDTVLVAGIDSVVGANLASSISGECRVVGLGLKDAVSLLDCETAYCPREDAETIRSWVANVRPTRIVHCGATARPVWQEDDAAIPKRPALNSIESWTRIAAEFDIPFTLISTDAVFTGPWLFHTEDSNCRCDSSPARLVRQIEKTVANNCPTGLIVRTHVFGWSHGNGWLERTLDDLDAGIAGPFDFHCHATPILATDFVEVLRQAWQAGLEGVYHIAGAERLNPNQFAHRLAAEFGLPSPQPVNGNSLMERPVGFGCGESSLHTTRIRKALDVSMPTFADGLERLREQRHNGYCDRLKSPVIREKVA